MQITAKLEDDLDIEAWVEQMIEENGYAQISVHDPQSGQPGFAFTIGLEQSRQVPELLCLGVAPDVAGQLFSLCINAHDRARCDLAAGNQDVAGLVDGFLLRIRRGAAGLTCKANAVRPRRGADIARMVQVLIPDNAGCFPGEAGCDARVAASQDPDRLLMPGLPI